MACTKDNLPAGDRKRLYMMTSTRKTVHSHVRNQRDINKTSAVFVCTVQCLSSDKEE